MLTSIHDVVLGSAFSEKVTFDDETMRKFIQFSRDSAGIHVKEKFSKGKGFDDLVVHGFLLSTNFSRILGMELPGENTVIGTLNLVFHEPVYAGDVVEYKVEVCRIMESLKSVLLNLTITKSTGEICVKGKSSCFFKE